MSSLEGPPRPGAGRLEIDESSGREGKRLSVIARESRSAPARFTLFAASWSFRWTAGSGRGPSGGRPRLGRGGRGCDSRLSSEVNAQSDRIASEMRI